MTVDLAITRAANVLRKTASAPSRLDRAPNEAKSAGLADLVARVEPLAANAERVLEIYTSEVGFDFADFEGSAGEIAKKIETATSVMTEMRSLYREQTKIGAEIEAMLETLEQLQTDNDKAYFPFEIEQCEEAIAQLRALTPTE